MGSEDGFLRGVSIYPNKICGILGKHSDDEEHFPIEKIGISHCKKFAGSISNDDSIQFYDISNFTNKRKNSLFENQDMEMESDNSENDNKIENEQKISNINKNNEFFDEI